MKPMKSKYLDSLFPVTNMCCLQSLLSDPGSRLITPTGLTTFLCSEYSFYFCNNDCIILLYLNYPQESGSFFFCKVDTLSAVTILLSKKNRKSEKATISSR